MRIPRRLLCSPRCLLAFAAVIALAVSNSHAAPAPRGSTPRPIATSQPVKGAPVMCDQDGDGALRMDEPACRGTDCNDSNKNVNPYATEGDTTTCSDGMDNNCDGKTDCADAGCEGQRVPMPDSFTLKPDGMCCGPETSGGNAKVVDIFKDADNCGGCGIRCQNGRSCVDGTCLGACEIAQAQCFTDPKIVAQLSPPISKGPLGDFPKPIQQMLNAYLGNPSCPRPTREPTFHVRPFSKPLTDLFGRPTGETVRGVCVSIRF